MKFASRMLLQSDVAVAGGRRQQSAVSCKVRQLWNVGSYICIFSLSPKVLLPSCIVKGQRRELFSMVFLHDSNPGPICKKILNKWFPFASIRCNVFKDRFTSLICQRNVCFSLGVQDDCDVRDVCFLCI